MKHNNEYGEWTGIRNKCCLTVIIPQIVLSELEKTEYGRKILEDDNLLKFRGPINT